MIIKKYDMYQQQDFRYSLYNSKSISNLYCLTILLMWRFGYFRKEGILNFIAAHKNGFSFEEIDISIDDQNNLVYISEGWHGYHNKPTTPEIERLLEAENFIQLCKIEFLDYVVMSKDNFMHLLLAWDKILNQVPCFAILYQNDKDWYDVLPFENQEAMEQFVADHTKKE